ncbi:hypothetical protein AMI01nite_28150 [Aneurinibacillus migulanus]|nr:hypothetical protein AMI01nite_28150 [Aneurinibacillus migulanus]
MYNGYTCPIADYHKLAFEHCAQCECLHGCYGDSGEPLFFEPACSEGPVMEEK